METVHNVIHLYTLFDAGVDATFSETLHHLPVDSHVDVSRMRTDLHVYSVSDMLTHEAPLRQGCRRRHGLMCSHCGP